MGSFDEPEIRRRLAAPAWLAWIDDAPQAFFAHPTRIVLIDAASGRVDVTPARWWPLLNDASLWMSDAERTDMEQIVYSELHVRKGGGS